MENIYKDAIEHYGALSQKDKLIEEMAELTQALLKDRRKPTGKTMLNLHEEFADVKIVMAQVETLLNAEVLNSYMKDKLVRLENLVAMGNKDVHKYKND